ncbi:MAG: CPBP family intramembrane metalloprotease [Anaerolineales bacterium]|nr:CPBP family intramembrane metalloprotease [Anaerolineales bacterium]
MKEPGFFNNYDTSVVIGILLAIGFGIALIVVGPGFATRNFLAEAIILAATFAVARQYLPWKDAPKERLKGPRRELLMALLGYVLIMVGARAHYTFGLAWPWLAGAMLLPVIAMVSAGYGPKAWGLRLPKPSEIGVLAVVILLTYGLSRALGAVLPASELPSEDVVNLVAPAFTTIGNVVVVAVLAAILEEIFFRVYLQPRLAAYLPGRWAVLVQALMYSAAFLPLYLFGNRYPLPLAGALVLVTTNGVLAGYFWRKTGNLWLLILLHLLAFGRYGL